MSAIASSILTLLQYAPQAISEITSVYNSVKSALSSEDVAAVDAALAEAQARDAKATAEADDALAQAANR